MREESKPWHLDTLSTFNNILYDELLHPHQILSSLKEINFTTSDYQGEVAEIGFFAKKDNDGVERKYFVKENDRKEMPFKVADKETFKLKTTGGYDLVIIPQSIVPFRITSKQMFTTRVLVDTIAPFKNTSQDEYTLLKIIAITGYVSKLFVCVSSNPEFGKSSIYELLHYMTDKSPVFKPRSIPGVLHHITESGNIVFDEIPTKREVKDIIEEFSLMIGGGKNQYINGARCARGMKQKYDCTNQSITFLYNELKHYSDPEREFFDYCFANNPAMDSRFLKFKFEGRMIERFDKEFNVEQVAQDNKMLYINIVKTLLWLSDTIKSNKFKRRYNYTSPVSMSLNGRRLQNYELITLVLDMYCECEEEYNRLIKVLDNSIIGYKTMITQQRVEHKR